MHNDTLEPTLLHDSGRDVDATSVGVEDFEDGGENALREGLEKPLGEVFVFG